MSDQVVIQKETSDIIYKIAQIDKPETLSDETIKLALCVIQKKLSDAESLDIISQETKEGEYSEADWQRDLYMAGFGETKKILVVDDIGVVTYQLKVLFQKIGFEVDTAKDIYSAAQLVRKNVYDFVVMDLVV